MNRYLLLVKVLCNLKIKNKKIWSLKRSWGWEKLASVRVTFWLAINIRRLSGDFSLDMHGRTNISDTCTKLLQNYQTVSTLCDVLYYQRKLAVFLSSPSPSPQLKSFRTGYFRVFTGKKSEQGWPYVFLWSGLFTTRVVVFEVRWFKNTHQRHFVKSIPQLCRFNLLSLQPFFFPRELRWHGQCTKQLLHYSSFEPANLLTCNH